MQVEISQYFTHTLNVTQVVANGNEGYRALSMYDPFASISYPYNNWMNTGLKASFCDSDMSASMLQMMG